MSLKYISPIGDIYISANSDEIIAISFKKEEEGDTSPLLLQAKRELDEYFNKKRDVFSLPLDFSNLTAFQRRVLEEVRRIPYGEVRTYKEIARLIGCEDSQRAVGRALNMNPFLIVIPCHRVVSKSSLGGFALSLDIKEYLLSLESKK